MNCSRFAGAIHPEIAQCAIEGLRPSLARCQPRTQLALVAQAILCQVPGHALHIVIRTSFTLCASAHPAVHCSGPRGEEVEFAHQAVTVVHQHASIQTLDAHPFARQRPADFPKPPLQL